MKTYRTKRILTTTALYIIESEGSCADVDCHFCPLNGNCCTVCTGRLTPHSRKPLLIKYLVDEYGESKTKEMIMEVLI